MEGEGKIAKFFFSYADDRETLKTLVNHELREKTREERLSIKRKILDELAKESEKKILSDDGFKVSTAEFVLSDLQYCERMQSDPESMTVGDLDFEKKKLEKMLAIIEEEKNSAHWHRKSKFLKTSEVLLTEWIISLMSSIRPMMRTLLLVHPRDPVRQRPVRRYCAQC